MLSTHSARGLHFRSSIFTARRLLMVVAIAAMLPPSLARATTYYWDTTVAAPWETLPNWTTDPTGSTIVGSAVPGSSDTAVFNGSAINGIETILFDAPESITGITFANTGSTLFESANSTPQSLTIGTGGITINANTGPVTLDNAANPMTFLIGGNQSWANNSSSLLSVVGNVSNVGTSTAYTLTMTGTGTTNIGGLSSDGGGSGTLALTKSGTGTLALSGANAYSGNTTVGNGILPTGFHSGSDGNTVEFHS